MMESRVWIQLERLISLITILVLVLAIWNTLLRVETKQASQVEKINATLEAIRERIGDDEAWQRLKSPLEKSLQESN
jgi:uncharacterized membrane protein